MELQYAARVRIHVCTCTYMYIWIRVGEKLEEGLMKSSNDFDT